MEVDDVDYILQDISQLSRKPVRRQILLVYEAVAGHHIRINFFHSRSKTFPGSQHSWSSICANTGAIIYPTPIPPLS